ncbi:hypothetical protein D3C81_1056960 [compost metagenome]
MSDISNTSMLLLSLQRALLGQVHPILRQASIKADPTLRLVTLRFEYDGEPTEIARESCSCAATEVIADFPAPWRLDEQHVATSANKSLSPLIHIAYRRAEAQHAT